MYRGTCTCTTSRQATLRGETCPLAAYGYNREGKKDKKQVVLGVIYDLDGCPI